MAEEEIWIPAIQAVVLLAPLFGGRDHEAQEAIIDRAASGLIASRCQRSDVERTINWRPAGRDREDDAPVWPTFWADFRAPNHRLREAWPTGDFTCTTTYDDRRQLETHGVTTRVFGATFRLSDLRRTFAGAVAAPSHIDEPPAQHPVPSRVAGPRLSEAHLQAWWTFYRAVVPPHEDTEARASSHLQRSFPGFSVARNRIRRLRGAGRPGPKPRTAE